MATRGLWQLKRMVLSYCDFSGSSRGSREFIESLLPSFSKSNPQIEFFTEMLRGRPPTLQGTYVNGYEKSIGVRNLDPAEVLQQATRLRNSTGRKVKKLISRHETSKRSIQGVWTPTKTVT